MAQPHDLALVAFRGDGERRVAALELDDERMIAPGAEALRQAFEDPRAVMVDLGGVAVHRALRPRDEAAEDFAHHLVAEADAEDRELARILAHDVHRLARLVRRAGAGRDDDGLGGRDVLRRHRVVAHHARRLPQLLEIARHVVDEAVVVVDDQDHGAERLHDALDLGEAFLVLGGGTASAP